LAKGEAASALAITSALPKVVLATSIAGVGDVVKAGATETGQILAGTRHEFELTDALIEGLKTAGVDGIDGAVTESIGPWWSGTYPAR
jgi:hypothetical protein